MKYLTMMRGSENIEEISKAKARECLEGHWKKKALDDIFDNNRMFRLYTPYRDIWTKSDDGLVPVPWFYGVVG